MNDESEEPRRLDRRSLVRGGLVGAASTLAAAGGFATARELAGDDDQQPTRRRGARADARLFPLDPNYTNLTTFLLAPHARPVREAIERHSRALDSNAARYLRESEVVLEDKARAAAARYLDSKPEQVALTDSTTMGLGLVYARLKLEPGDEVLTTAHDFYSTHEALRLRAQLDGVKVRRIRLYDEPQSASTSEIVRAVERGVRPRTRCLALTWVHSSTGVKLPLREIAEAVAKVNRPRRGRDRILMCVDAVHGFGIEDTTPAGLGADVFISGCHKWLFGPRGTGLVWATHEAWERLAPTIPSFDTEALIAWVEGRRSASLPGPLMSPGGFHSFENRWALPDAFALHERLGGRSKIAKTSHALAVRLKRGLAEIPGVDVKTPLDNSLAAALVCVDVGGRQPGEVVDRLREDHRVMASVTPYATRYVRFGPSIANTEKDVDRALEAVEAITRA